MLLSYLTSWIAVTAIELSVICGCFAEDVDSYEDPLTADYFSRQNYKSLQEQVLVSTLLVAKGYDKKQRPGGNHTQPKKIPGDVDELYTRDLPPTMIDVSMKILSTSGVDDVNMEFTAQIQLVQSWIDRRLRFINYEDSVGDYIILAADQEVWRPDTYILNERRGHLHDVDKPNEFTKFRSDGHVIYSKRLTLTLSCPMNLLLFPHDRQECKFMLGSSNSTTTDSYSSSDIIYRWTKPEPCTILQSVHSTLPKFRITGVIDEVVHIRHGGAGDVPSSIQITLKLQRVFAIFLLQLYIPSSMLVAVCCISFWIDWRSAQARVPLSIVTFLTLTAQSNGVTSTLPPVPYTRAIDIWIGFCTALVFGALLEYAIVNYIGKKEEKRLWGTLTGAGYAVKMKYEEDRSYIPSPLLLQQRLVIANEITKDLKTDANLMDDIDKPPVILAKKPVAYRVNKFLDEIAEPAISRRLSRRALVSAAEESGSPPATSGASRTRLRHVQPFVSERPGAPRNIISGKSHMITDAQNGHNAPPLRMQYVDADKQRRECIRAANILLKRKTRAERIDEISRVLFPTCFILFNITYFSLYLPE